MTTTIKESPFLLRRFQSLLGIVPVGLFLLEHAFTNSMAFFYGPEEFNENVLFLQSLPFVLFLEVFGIWIPILVHAGIGIYIWIFGLANVQHYGYLRNWLYSLQRWSGVITLIFVLYHVYKLRIEWVFTTDMKHIQFDYVNAYFQTTWHVIFYFIGVAASVFHFANGVWNFLVKWGITIGPRSQAVSGYICTALGIVVFLFFIGSLFAFTTHELSEAAKQYLEAAH